MKSIFDTVNIGGLTLKNRIVRSATLEGGAEEGAIIPVLKKIYTELADGGVGLIITGMMGIGDNACLTPHMVKIPKEEFHCAFKEIADAVHGYDCKIVVQISHCGSNAMWIEKGEYPMGPSEREKTLSGKPSKAMTREDIQQAVLDFGKAAERCREAGADGVQIHAAHGYLLAHFLSPYYNKRTDEYGGGIENRARIVFEVLDEIRAKAGVDYPVLIKINYSDLTTPGLNGDECIWVCRELEKRGISAIELSSGLCIDMKSRASQPVKDESEEGSFVEGALKLSSAISIPVISVGGYRTPSVIEKFLNAGNIAAIALCRPLVYEPALVNRWKSQDLSKVKCISCSKCFTSPIACHKSS